MYVLIGCVVRDGKGNEGKGSVKRMLKKGRREIKIIDVIEICLVA